MTTKKEANKLHGMLTAANWKAQVCPSAGEKYIVLPTGFVDRLAWSGTGAPFPSFYNTERSQSGCTSGKVALVFLHVCLDLGLRRRHPTQCRRRGWRLSHRLITGRCSVRPTWLIVCNTPYDLSSLGTEGASENELTVCLAMPSPAGYNDTRTPPQRTTSRLPPLPQDQRRDITGSRWWRR